MSHADSISQILLTGPKRPRIVLFSLFAFCILVISVTFFALSIGKSYMGTVLSMDAQGWIVESVDTSGLAGEAGIRVGDRPIEVNGQPAQTFLEKYKKAGAVFGRLIRELTVIDNDGQLKSVTLENAPLPWRTLIELATRFTACVIFWLIGFYVFFKRPRNLAALLLCLCGLAFGLALSGNMAVERAIPTAVWFEIAATVIGPWLLLHFFLILPDEHTRLRKSPLVYLIYLPAAITLILFPLIGYVDGQPLSGFRTLRLFEYGIGFLAAAGVAIFNFFRAVSIRTRQQMKIVLISCLIALVPLLLLNLLPAAIQEKIIIPPGFSILFIVFIPLGMGYAVVTQKLMDIDFVIRRGIIYGLITLVMAAVISIAIFLVAIFHTSVGTPIQILAALVLGGMAAVLFGPIKKRVESLIDKLFYKDRYDYRQVIQSLSSALNSVNSLSDISRLIVGTIVNTLNLMGGCLFVRTQSDSLEIIASQGTFIDAAKQKHLRALISQQNSMIEFPNLATAIDSDIAFITRLMTGEQEIGVLCLSHKISGQRFSSDDLYLIQGISSVSSIALHSAMLIRDVSLRDTFVSIASHELRTPLTAIIGFTDLLLRRDPPNATRKKWLRNILENGQRITDMANDLLNVTRIQSGKIALKLERLKLSDILSEQLDITRESIHKHEFVVDIEPNLPDVIVDRDKFGQVIGNLLSNAIKYSPKGGCITLSAYNDPSRHCVVVSVTDEGIGISPEDKNSLFTTFHRIQRPETQSIRGSGLGLFIAKEWTEAMGGEIWVESELNKGSTFFMTIPVQPDHPYDS
jgi:signal transduction histidine kinase